MASPFAAPSTDGPVPQAIRPTGGRSVRVEVIRPSSEPASHGTRADAPAPSKLTADAPELPADPLKLPGEFDV